MKKRKNNPALLFASLAAMLSLCACENEETSSRSETPAPEKTLPANEKLLSRHDTQAVFTGTRHHQCRGMTRLCPDKCGNSGTLAIFEIATYNDYQRPDRYGDDPAGSYAFMLRSTAGTSDVSPAVAEIVNSLRPGDKVHLVWDHVYVSDPQASFPKRIVRKIERLRSDEE